MKKHIAVAGVLASLALALAGCSGGAGGAPSDPNQFAKDFAMAWSADQSYRDHACKDFFINPNIDDLPKLSSVEVTGTADTGDETVLYKMQGKDNGGGVTDFLLTIEKVKTDPCASGISAGS